MRDIIPPAAPAEDWADALVGSIHTRTGAVQSWFSRSERQCKRNSKACIRQNIFYRLFKDVINMNSSSRLFLNYFCKLARFIFRT